MLAGCERQVRAGLSNVYGMDFPAVLALAEARGLRDRSLIAELLPDVERLVVAHYQPGESEDGD